MTDSDQTAVPWRVLRNFMRFVTGRDLPPDDRIEVDWWMSESGPELNAALGRFLERALPALEKRLHGEPLTAEEAEYVEELGEQLTWWFAQPENEEAARDAIRAALRGSSESFADSVAQGSEYAEEFADLLLTWMPEIRKQFPDVAAEFEEDLGDTDGEDS